MKYHRIDIVEAARCTYGEKPPLATGARSHGLALEEVDGVLRIRTVGGPMTDMRTPDGVRHLYERDVKTYAGPWKTLAEAAKFFGVEKR